MGAAIAAGIGAGIAMGMAGMSIKAGGQKPHHGGKTILWGRNNAMTIYTAKLPPGRAGTATLPWEPVQGGCVQLDVSHKWVYTVNRADEIYRKHANNSGNWEKVGGLLTCITVTNNGHIWGINRAGKIYTARANAPAGNMGWQEVVGTGVHIQASNKWVYHINAIGDVYRKRTNNSGNWEKVEGQKLKCIAITDHGHIWGINHAGEIWTAHTDKPASHPGWVKVPGTGVQLHASGGFVYHVNSSGEIYSKRSDNSGGWTRCTGSMTCIAVHHAGHAGHVPHHPAPHQP